MASNKASSLQNKRENLLFVKSEGTGSLVKPLNQSLARLQWTHKTVLNCQDLLKVMWQRDVCQSKIWAPPATTRMMMVIGVAANNGYAVRLAFYPVIP